MVGELRGRGGVPRSPVTPDTAAQSEVGTCPCNKIRGSTLSWQLSCLPLSFCSVAIPALSFLPPPNFPSFNFPLCPFDSLPLLYSGPRNNPPPGPPRETRRTVPVRDLTASFWHTGVSTEKKVVCVATTRVLGLSELCPFTVDRDLPYR